MPAPVQEQLKDVHWRDLTHLSAVEIAKEILLPVPWLLVSWWLAQRGWYVVALGASFLFFLAGLRQVHDAYHYNLGLSRTATEWLMGALSIVMLGSMHAVQFTHLRHHGHCLEEDDVEAMSARMPWYRALLWGPVFPVAMHRQALRMAAPRQRQWILGELVANFTLVAVIFGLLDSAVLRFHVFAMLAGHCLTAFFAVWTVHHDCGEADYPARTVRNPLKSLVVMNMFFHAEHHLYPKVPTCRLPVLAKRIDAAVPTINLNRVY